MIVVAYAYKADVWCGGCIVDEVCKDQGIEPFDTFIGSELALDKIAENISYSEKMGTEFDRYDERTFDSDEFPKVIFQDQIEDHEYCCSCHSEI